MFDFPQGLYCDVRIENIAETKIRYAAGQLEELNQRSYKAAFIRVFDGKRWFYSSLSDTSLIQREINALSAIASPDPDIGSNPVVKMLSANQGVYDHFGDRALSSIPAGEKQKLLVSFFLPLKRSRLLTSWKGYYNDRREVKEIYSSKGAELCFDMQRCGIAFNMDFSSGNKRFSEIFQRGSNIFEELAEQQEEHEASISKCENFTREARPVKPGKYQVILSPAAAGLFAHESFGHRSEADFVQGDKNGSGEWETGCSIGNRELNIIDDGQIMGSGFTPFDDEGTQGRQTYLIKDGILSGRLHSCQTAALMKEAVTGNARSTGFEFEPIVRMTNTYISAGLKTREQLFNEVKEGIFIDSVRHGSGLSTFTLAPSRAYMVRNGAIAEPVNISVVSGSVFDALRNINGISDKVQFYSFVLGGCGKIEQYPLPVSFGGPYVRVAGLDVR